ncbi:protein lin-9 homolog [Exaiptasia diaphana]|uniref:DIRP domain-containing protein n=1 Tax=Exaiptasia diaphana TaxID=2652724 RepID=A0A913Y6J9_EXADI|nr:protein lin-9 homolog [Exaiptasia diaphana]
MAEEESSAEALVSLKGIGSQSSPFSSPSKRGTLTRAKRRRQQDEYLEDEYQEELFQDEELSSSKSRFARSPTLFGANGTDNKKDAKLAFTRLQNLLKLPKAAKWCYFEWFYSSIDKVLFEGDNDFCICLKESFPNLKVKKMRRVEWREVRRLMGKPRRCSSAFFHEERESLNEKRKKIRLLQQKKVSELSKFKDLPEEVPLPLVIGTKVTARLRAPQDGVFTGQIEAVDTQNCSYRVTFDRPGLGTHSIPDTEVLSEELQETMPLSSFLLKERPRTAVFPPTYTPPSGLGLHGSPSMLNDPLLGASPARLKLQEALSQQGQGGTLGGFPIRFLILVTRLSKILLVKKECIEKLKEMNTQAEKMKSYQDPIDKDFQRRYACVVLELERLNKDLNDYLNGVQDYCQELAPEHGLHTLDQTVSVKRKCDKEAVHLVEEQNCKLGSLSVKNQSTLKIINKLTSVLLQIKSLAENELNTFEFKSLSDAVEEIKSSIDPSNISCFQNHVEIHVAHIQSGLSQMGNLHAFSS